MAAGEWKNSFGFVFLLILVRVSGVHAIVHVAGWISQPPWLLKVALGWETEIPGIWDSPYFKLESENFEATSGEDLGLRVCAGGGIPKIAIGITGLEKMLGHGYSIEEPFEDPHTPDRQK